ncbi:hypothetical protein [Staphylococcus delphini]|uniref:hypothetical protein n=1 Tax=Staphylococcus delphini TaxID=53344 RepID=UPI0021D20EC5|nr:hypothetical protein [Staphylococcus delphini]UXS43322.1 hypothetical protein MUA39_08030 [Staphylococcus delphini]UXV44016.1 hypothetical protein MUA63_08000 [Staphylococcus delphini]
MFPYDERKAKCGNIKSIKVNGDKIFDAIDAFFVKLALPMIDGFFDCPEGFALFLGAARRL